MSRLLYYGCSSGNDVAMIQNDLNVITGHTQQGSAMALLEVDGIFGNITQARVLEFQRINFLTMDGIVGDQTRDKLDELFVSEPGLQARRLQGGIGDGSNDFPQTPPQESYGKMPAVGKTGGSNTGFGKKTSTGSAKTGYTGLAKGGGSFGKTF